MINNHVKSHQMLVAIDFTNANSTFVERATRFADSLNRQDTIKADIVSIHNGGVVSGFHPEAAGLTLSDEDVRSWATDLGYNIVTVTRPPLSETVTKGYDLEPF